jgi:ABC-type transport system substrate-binding protein
MRKPLKVLKVGCPTYWGSLVPALQHTAYADALLSNQFESLVREGHGGAIVPALALSWKISSDFRTFTFKLDTQRQFSDGRKLSAQTVKEAWEFGLALPAQSANSSLQDVLYLIEGFENFKKRGSLDGIRVLDDQTIEVQFVKAFRTALSEFATGRMSIFLPNDGNPLGTGPYVIKNQSEATISMEKNPYFNGDVGFERVEVKVVPPTDIHRALESGEIDVYAFADRAALQDCDSAEIECFSGLESGHSILIPNGLPGRLFSNSKYRLALQSLIHKKIEIQKLPSNYRRNLDIDPQVYLKLQPGRLPADEVDKILRSGEEFISEFVAATQSRPIYLVTSEMNNWVQVLLEGAGVKFDSKSGTIDTKERVRMYYKSFEPDLFVSGTSVASGDPDGLFHILAQNGAITSPVLFRKPVSDLLERGREITDISKLDGHYAKVSRAVLQEVPFVHIGFIRGLFAFNPKKVAVREGLRNRESNQFTLFQPN